MLDARVVSVVDDDESIRASVGNLLMSVGFRVETFGSAEAFLESIFRKETGCLLLDLRMPGMGGEDLLKHLAVHGTPLPTIILSTRAEGVVRKRLLLYGVLAFVSKPFRSELLLDAVRAAMGARP
jgi:FixJ family two-component response regulator